MHPSLLLTLLPVVLGAPATKREEPAALRRPAADPDALIEGKYIVKFKDFGASSALNNTLSTLSAAPEHVFENAFRGFAGTLDEETLNALRDHPDVDYIEQDAEVSIQGYWSQPGSTWGLGRLSHRSSGSTTYVYDDSAGSGTCSYVLDTGIDVGHQEFGNRAAMVANFAGGANTDEHGHGTHVAGTIGSNSYGVAFNTRLYGVKVLTASGKGPWSAIIAGMDFVAGDARKRNCPRGVIVNMSVGGSYSAAVDSAAAALVANNIFLAVAAGNSNDNSYYYSPASTPSACTVGATTSSDGRSSFSNYGDLVDIFAPGSSILSTLPGGRTGTMSGTSMATPHIAGLGAYIAGLEGFPGAGALCNRLKQLATRNVISGLPGGTANLLAFNGNPF